MKTYLKRKTTFLKNTFGSFFIILALILITYSFTSTDPSYLIYALGGSLSIGVGIALIIER